MLNEIQHTTRKYEQLATEALYIEEQLAILTLTKLQLKPSDINSGRWALWDLEDKIDNSKQCRKLNEKLNSLMSNSKLTKIQKYEQILSIMKQKQEILETAILGPNPVYYDNLYLYDIVYSDYGLRKQEDN